MRYLAQGIVGHDTRRARSANDGGGCDLSNGDQSEHLAKARHPERDTPHCKDRHGAADQARRFRGMAEPARKRAAVNT